MDDMTLDQPNPPSKLNARLDSILAQCREAVEVASKATPGPWAADDISGRFVWPCPVPDADSAVIKIYTPNECADRDFIALSRTICPAAAQATIEAIGALRNAAERSNSIDLIRFAQTGLQRIASQWPK